MEVRTGAALIEVYDNLAADDARLEAAAEASGMLALEESLLTSSDMPSSANKQSIPDKDKWLNFHYIAGSYRGQYSVTLHDFAKLSIEQRLLLAIGHSAGFTQSRSYQLDYTIRLMNKLQPDSDAVDIETVQMALSDAKDSGLIRPTRDKYELTAEAERIISDEKVQTPEPAKKNRTPQRTRQEGDVDCEPWVMRKETPFFVLEVITEETTEEMPWFYPVKNNESIISDLNALLTDATGKTRGDDAMSRRLRDMEVSRLIALSRSEEGRVVNIRAETLGRLCYNLTMEQHQQNEALLPIETIEYIEKQVEECAALARTRGEPHLAESLALKINSRHPAELTAAQSARTINKLELLMERLTEGLPARKQDFELRGVL